jgi:hypothetical protein
MSVLAGRDWTVWEQINDVLTLALNRATSAYINSNGALPSSVVHDLASVKQYTAGQVAAGAEVPDNIATTDIYRQIDNALDAVANEPDVMDAINMLPFSQALTGDTSGSSDVFGGMVAAHDVNQGPGVMGPLLAIGVIGALGLLGWQWVKGR